MQIYPQTLMINRVLISFILFTFAINATAQKVKYKDLIQLLNAKQYEKVEPFLKKYLKDNDDNPNAYLYMGIVFQEKALKNNPLLETEILSSTIDSALLNYDKAYKTIDERELRKNDEYYEAYMRRDIRTGKFEIKLSDVQLDIENRVKNLKDRKEKVKLLKNYFTESATAYTKANERYKSIQSKYADENEFLLQSNDVTVASLKRVSSAYDSSLDFFEKYKSTSKELGKTGYTQALNKNEIKSLHQDGATTTDFFKDDIQVWDYKKWTTKLLETIEKEINPLREQLVAYDVAINQLRTKLQKDSVSVKNDIAKLSDSRIESLKKYDNNPMPLQLFELKKAELEYGSDLSLNKHLKDSSNINRKIKAVSNEINDLKNIDSIAQLLNKRDFQQEQKNYQAFITNAYGTVSVLQNTISSTLEVVEHEKVKKGTLFIKLMESLHWIVSSSDSIPLYIDSKRNIKFRPLVIEPEKFTFGLNYADSLKPVGYFYSITPSRVPDVKDNFPVDQTNFKRRFFSQLKGLATSDSKGNAFIVLVYSNQKVKEKIPVTIAKIYRADGLAWGNNFVFDSTPSSLLLGDNGDISVTISLTDGSSKNIVIDKNGKEKK